MKTKTNNKNLTIKEEINNWFESIEFCDYNYPLTEAALLDLILSKKWKTKFNIQLHKTPKFIQVKNIKLHTESYHKYFEYPVKTYKSVEKNNIIIEPVFIKSPPILELLYKKQKINYQLLNMSQEKFDEQNQDNIKYFNQTLYDIQTKVFPIMLKEEKDIF